MEQPLAFRKDLYRGTAEFYDRYRPPYPQVMFDDLCSRLPLSGRDRLLDLACGTGQVAFPLSRVFGHVWAVDQESEFIAYGRAKAEAAGIENITWIQSPAETVTIEGPFDLITVGNAFHRLNRDLVAGRMFSWLQPGGGVALLSGSGPWPGDQVWQLAVGELFEAWMARLGANDRVPAGWEEAMDRYPHERVLANAGFDFLGKFEFDIEETWTVETFTGYVFSTSFLNRSVLGDQTNSFQHDLAELLRSHQPNGVFHVSARYELRLGRKPTPAT